MRLQTLSEARWILTFFALLAVAASFFALWLSFFFLLLFLCTVAFFRDPERMVPADPSLVVDCRIGRKRGAQNKNAPCRNFFIDL